MAFCKACGTTIDDDARFCRQCGVDQSAAGPTIPVAQSESDVASTAPAARPAANGAEAPWSPRRKRLLLVAGLIGLAVLVGVVVLVVARGEDDPFVGYWQGEFRDMTGERHTDVVRIEKTAYGYRVSFARGLSVAGADHAVIEDGLLVPQRGGSLRFVDGETLEFEWTKRDETPVVLKRVGQDEYDEQWMHPE